MKNFEALGSVAVSHHVWVRSVIKITYIISELMLALIVQYHNIQLTKKQYRDTMPSISLHLPSLCLIIISRFLSQHLRWLATLFCAFYPWHLLCLFERDCFSVTLETSPIILCFLSLLPFTCSPSLCQLNPYYISVIGIASGAVLFFILIFLLKRVAIQFLWNICESLTFLPSIYLFIAVFISGIVHFSSSI